MTDAAPQIRRVRSLFLSDVHLGSRHSQAKFLTACLARLRPENLYLVGDLIDGWLLKKRWHWPQAYHDLLALFVSWAEDGTSVYVTPGNHDEFLRDLNRLGVLASAEHIKFQNEFVHSLADGRRFLVTHGDLYDRIEQHRKWLSQLGTVGFELLLTIDGMFGRLRRARGPKRLMFAGKVKRWVKRKTVNLTEYRENLFERATDLDCDGVICGHVHAPALTQFEELAYCNTGDWIEGCTALVETDAGRLQLWQFHRPDDIRILGESEEVCAESTTPTILAGDEGGTVVVGSSPPRSKVERSI
jgi:UDP-2,3-diacylglucosamine pyrophosphatase LpxH